MVGQKSKIAAEKAAQTLKNSLKQLRKVKTWQLLLILAPLLFITATFLRFDHIKMIELRSAVLTADEEKDDAKIAETLSELKSFTFSHIVVNVVERNGDSYVTFGTGPFYLENQYLRKTAEILEQAEQNVGTDANPNGNVYAAAMSVCQPQAQRNGWAWNNPEYLNCYLTEINKYPASERIEDTVVVSLPDTSLYRYDFASPMWAPTPAGFAAILCLLLIAVIIVRAASWLVIHITILFLK